MQPEKIIRVKKAVFMIGVVAMALAAGASGAALVASELVGSLPLSSAVAPAPAARSAAKLDVTKVDLAAKGTVVIYKKKVGTAALDKIFLPNDIVGGGAVLTSDGWIIASSSVLAGRGDLVAVFGDKSSAPVDATKVVRDDATGLAFIKTDAHDLAVASFGDDTALAAADPVFSVSPNAIVSASVLSQRTVPVQAKADYVESTERLARRIMIDRYGLPGATVVNVSGEVIGFDMGDGTVVPATFVTEVLRELFKSGSIVRPNVGAHYVSLDDLPNAHDAGFAASGAYVTGGTKNRATEKGSAAEAAGLKEGDVITYVEHDRINDEETLAERFQDYAPGAKVELTVVRAGKEIKVGLTLK
jgi:serine protease Do